VISRLDPEDTFEPPDIERLADHITGFSVQGIRELAEEKEIVPK
jgi:hypothetical protein